MPVSTWVTLLIVLVTNVLVTTCMPRHGFETTEQMSIGTNSPPQQVPLGAPCPVTNVKI
jgi:hypothetical protein